MLNLIYLTTESLETTGTHMVVVHVFTYVRHNAQILETFSLRHLLGVKAFLISGDVNSLSLSVTFIY